MMNRKSVWISKNVVRVFRKRLKQKKIKNKHFVSTFMKAGSYLQQLADFGQDSAHVLHMEPPSQSIDGKLFYTSRLNMQSYIKDGHLLL